jgi:hypothetical protein
MGRSLGSVRTQAAFFIGVAALVALKLWLTSEIRVLPLFAPHDASNFVEHAKAVLSGDWFGPYDNLTLIKGAVFPLYLAAVQETGLPLPLAHQLLYACACLIACIAAAPLIRNPYARLLAFAMLYFNPFTYGSFAWVAYRSQLTESEALIAVSCAFAIFVRRRQPALSLVPWIAGLDVSFAAFWLTREEGVWLVPCLAILLTAYLWAIRRETRRELLRRAAVLSSLGLVWVAAVGLVTIVNGHRYGWYTTVEMQAPEFVSAYNALARIEAAPVYHVAVPRAAREIAYAASPAAAELRAGLEGTNGKGWTSSSCTAWNVCGDIGGGWFMWAFRDAVAIAGHYKSATEARAFYVELARQLDAACDSRKIRCLGKARTLAPPVTRSDMLTIAGRFVDAARAVSTFSQIALEHWPPSARNPRLEEDYEFVTRSVLIADPATTFEGWLVHGPLHAVQVEGPSGPDASAAIVFRPSPDIQAVFARDAKRRTDETGIARFTVTGDCPQGCSLVLTDAREKRTRIPLDASTVNFRADGLVYHLDQANTRAALAENFDDRAKRGILRRIAWLYQAVLPYSVALALILTVLRTLRAFRRRSLAAAAHALLAAAVLAGGAVLLAILAIIDVTSFPAFSPEYMGGLFPLLLLWAGTTIVMESVAASRLIRSRRAAASRVVTTAVLLVAGMLVIGAFLQAKAAPQSLSAAPAGTAAPASRGHRFSCVRAVVQRRGVARGSVDDLQMAGAAVTVRGWAASAALQRPLAGVCLEVDGKIVAKEAVSYGLSRPDVAAAFGNAALQDSGYEVRVQAGDVAAGVHQLIVIGVDEQGGAEPLGPPRSITIR